MFDFDELDALEEDAALSSDEHPDAVDRVEEPVEPDASKELDGAEEEAAKTSLAAEGDNPDDNGDSSTACGSGGARETEPRGDELCDVDEVDDCPSEVWPDDVPNDLEALLPDSSPSSPVGGNGIKDSDASVPRPWQVVFSRVVIRDRPALDARVVGICSHSELLFEDPSSTDHEWVQLVDGLGFVLKDGRFKDPKLGMLLKPYTWSSQADVPREFHGRVFGLLKDGWVKLHAGHPLLGIGEIRRLRKAGEDAVNAACKATGFDFDTFRDLLCGEVDDLVAAQQRRVHGDANGFSGLKAFAKSPPSFSSGSGSGSAAPMQFVAATGQPAFGAAGSGAGGGHSGGFAWDRNGPSLSAAGGRVTADFAKRLVESMRQRSLPCEQDAVAILTKAEQLWSRSPTLTRLQVPATATLRVIDDLHGQYWDLLHIFETFGQPSPSNMYVFNGDLVDRGQFSVEVVLAVFAWKIALPDCVHVNRGNHEAENLNMLFGFQAEAKMKYSEFVCSYFSRAFRALPLSTVVNDSIFVVHGGLGSESPTLARIDRLERIREPQEGAALMTELLWSDPMDNIGISPSPRGGGVLFGPDVTQRFCRENNLTCIIRSHEMRPEGFDWTHGGLCLTLFSAANYCGVCANFGAVCSIKPRAGAKRLERTDMQLKSYEAWEPPDEPHARGLFGAFA